MTEPLDRPTRQHELDWLRALVILNVIAFHAVWLIFAIPGFSSTPKDALGSTMLRYYYLLVLPWQMPVMFFIAGMASYVSLRRRSARDYALERGKRLLVPLIFGMVSWFPLMAYFWPGVASERSLSDYVSRYWPECIGTIHNIKVVGRPARPGWGHLWFIAYLLIISVLVQPVVARVASRTSSRLRVALAWPLQGPWAVQILSLPLIAAIAAMSPTWPLYQNSLLGDWAWFTVSTIAFVYGYLLCTQKAFWQTVDTHRIRSSVFAVGCGIIVIWFDVPPLIAPSYTLRYLVYSSVVGLFIWSAIVSLLGLSRRFLAGETRVLTYLAPASYPLYFLHLFLMVIIGTWITQWGRGPALEFVLLSVASLGISLAVYEFAVRRFCVTRFLFGLK